MMEACHPVTGVLVPASAATQKAHRLRRRSSVDVEHLLAVVFVAFLPISAINFFPGDIGMNLSWPAFAILALVALRRMLPFPFQIGHRTSSALLARSLFFFFLWCSADTLLTGILFERQGIEAYGATPLSHSLSRMVLPIIIGLVGLVSFHLGKQVLKPALLDRIIISAALISGGYGLVQLVFGAQGPSWYIAVIKLIESGRNRPGPWMPTVQNYVALTGRLNLTTFEAAEAARLILILFVPVLVTPLNRAKRLAPWRVGLVLFLLGLILMAQTIVGLAGVATLLALVFVLSKPRARIAVAGGIAALSLLALAVMPPAFADRLQSVGRSGSDGDQSTITRAAFAVASLQVAIEHPVLGVGWSKDLFFIKDAMPEWGYESWEVKQCLDDGQALSAKSMVVRLLLYGGIPAFLILAFSFAGCVRDAFRRYKRTADPVDLRIVMTLTMFAVGGTLDGGIITGFFSWAAVGLTLGLSARMRERTPVLQTSQGVS